MKELENVYQNTFYLIRNDVHIKYA